MDVYDCADDSKGLFHQSYQSLKHNFQPATYHLTFSFDNSEREDITVQSQMDDCTTSNKSMFVINNIMNNSRPKHFTLRVSHDNNDEGAYIYGPDMTNININDESDYPWHLMCLRNSYGKLQAYSCDITTDERLLVERFNQLSNQYQL